MVEYSDGQMMRNKDRKIMLLQSSKQRNRPACVPRKSAYWFPTKDKIDINKHVYICVDYAFSLKTIHYQFKCWLRLIFLKIARSPAGYFVTLRQACKAHNFDRFTKSFLSLHHHHTVFKMLFLQKMWTGIPRTIVAFSYTCSCRNIHIYTGYILTQWITDAVINDAGRLL